MAKYFWITFTSVIFPIKPRNKMKNIWPCFRTYYLHVFEIKNGTVGDNYLITTNDYQVLTICHLFSQQMEATPDFILLICNIVAPVFLLLCEIFFLREITCFLSLLYPDLQITIMVIFKVYLVINFIENICFTLNTILDSIQRQLFAQLWRVIKGLYAN